MKETYTVAWAVWCATDDEGNNLKDYWERFDSYEESKLLYDEVLRDDNVYTASLGKEIQSNESSIYRYFENKHKLLLYLTSWYWSWIEYQLVFSTFNVINPTEKIEKSIEILTQTISQDSNYGHINEVLLNQIIINEFSKSYLTKEVDSENKEGYFSVFKRLVKRLEEIILEIDSSYPYPLSLASTVIEGALYQSFLKDHFTSITDCDSSHKIKEFLIHLVNTTLKNSKNVR